VAVLLGGLLLGAVISFTLVVMLPTNKRILDPSLESDSADADESVLALDEDDWTLLLEERVPEAA
jgi:hypothetical protein